MASALQTVVFTASIDNEVAIRDWIESVQKCAQRAQQALDDLNSVLRERAHIAISLHAEDNPKP